MGLMQLNENGWNKIETAIEVIKQNEPPEGYYVANSGGKDSGIVVDLCKRAGVKFDAHYNVSPIDPPEIYKFLREYHPETRWDYHAKGFWNLEGNYGLPTRVHRWCCKFIKESGGSGRTAITGVRWAEGTSRKSRCMIEPDKKDKTKHYLHPIICWTTTEVWEYYRMTNLPKVCLYEQGFKRVGCIGCPQDTRRHRLEVFTRYPKTAIAWRKFADRHFDNYPETPSLKLLATKDNYWNWWLSGKSIKAYLTKSYF